MFKRLKHPKGSANMLPNKAMRDKFGKLHLKIGTMGFKGWRYHPTKGFKKQSGFKAIQFISL